MRKIIKGIILYRRIKGTILKNNIHFQSYDLEKLIFFENFYIVLLYYTIFYYTVLLYYILCYIYSLGQKY